jgi:HD-like signal output (HDOD) protein/CheY-like chemotaxis protein
MTTILIVDDMPIIREPLALALRARGYETICAENGCQALRLLETHSVDLVLLDLTMPVMDGLSYLRAVQADPTIPRPPVILLTDVAERHAVLQAAHLGARDYLLKSHFSLEELLARIEQRLGATESQESPAPGRGPAEPGSAASESGDRHDTSPVPRDGIGALKSLKPMMLGTALEHRLASRGTLKAFSPTSAEVLKLTDDPNTSTNAIAQAIKRDPAIAVKILKLANSAAFARANPVESIDQAVIRIGTGAIRQAVLSISVIERFSSITFHDHIHPLQFWEHSIACGLIAAEMARALGATEPDIAFTMGLLHDLGRLLFVELLDDQYAEVLSTAHDLGLPVEEVESQLLSLNHAQAMDAVLRAWRYPKDLIDPIALHHSAPATARAMAPQRATDVMTLTLANRLAHALLLGSSGNEVIYPTNNLCLELNIESALVQRIEQTIPDQTKELKIALLSRSGHESWPERRELHAKALEAPFRPLFVSAAPEIDAYRILCDRLRENSGDIPNLSIVHVTESGDTAPVISTLRAAETEAHVGRLPLLILASAGDARLASQFAADRPCEVLRTPTAIPSFINSVNRTLRRPHTHAAA